MPRRPRTGTTPFVPVTIRPGSIRCAPGVRAGRLKFAAGHKVALDFRSSMTLEVLDARARGHTWQRCSSNHPFATRFLDVSRPATYSRELMDVIFEQPYCRIANVVQAGIAGRQAASRHLKALAGAGVLREQTFGKEKLFVHPKLMDLLTRDGNAYEPYRRKAE
jgi:hypothetical protein